MLYTRAWATALKTRMLTISLRKRLQGMLHKLTSRRVNKWKSWQVDVLTSRRVNKLMLT